MHDRALILKTHAPRPGDSYLVPRFLVVDTDADEVVAGFFTIEEAVDRYPNAQPTEQFLADEDRHVAYLVARENGLRRSREFLTKTLPERVRALTTSEPF